MQARVWEIRDRRKNASQRINRGGKTRSKHFPDVTNRIIKECANTS
jgi:hypothetical protein